MTIYKVTTLGRVLLTTRLLTEAEAYKQSFNSHPVNSGGRRAKVETFRLTSVNR